MINIYQSAYLSWPCCIELIDINICKSGASGKKCAVHILSRPMQLGYGYINPEPNFQIIFNFQSKWSVLFSKQSGKSPDHNVKNDWISVYFS